jgi:ribosomal protein L29
MKIKEKQTLNTMKAEELTKVLADAEGALELYALGRYSKQSKNVREGRLLKRKIAIIKTLIRQKELIHE